MKITRATRLYWGLLIGLNATATAAWASSSAVIKDIKDKDRSGVRWGGVPMLSVSSDRGVTYGALAQRFDYGSDGQKPFRSHLVFQARRMMKGPTDMLVSYEKLSVPMRWKLEAYASDSNNERYYGIGDSTPRDVALAEQGYYYYAHRALYLSSSARWRLPMEFPIELQGSAAAVARSSEAVGGTSTLFARDYGNATVQTLYGRFGLGLVYDQRDSEFIPSQGWYGTINGQVSPSLTASNPAWRRFDLDVRRYASFFQDRWLWIAAQLRYTSTSETTPLEEKARLGSMGTLRGLPLYRFASDHCLTLRTEVRSLWFRTRVFNRPLKTGSGVFADTGRIGDSLQRLASGSTHYAYGFSFFFSYFTDDFITTVDYGFSREGTAYYVRLGHAF